MTAIHKLTGPMRQPASGGPAKQIVILFHGVGADGSDLIPLADAWSPSLPDAVFMAPDAPFACDMAPFGRQWFSLMNRSLEALTAGVEAVAPSVDAFVSEQADAYGLTPDAVALVGFSQGTMTALYVAPRREQSVACVLGYSGAVLAGERLAAEARSKPRTLLIHGEADDVVSAQALPMSEQMLRAAGIPVAAHLRPGLGHGIDPVGMQMGGVFLSDALGATPDGGVQGGDT